MLEYPKIRLALLSFHQRLCFEAMPKMIFQIDLLRRWFASQRREVFHLRFRVNLIANFRLCVEIYISWMLCFDMLSTASLAGKTLMFATSCWTRENTCVVIF